jgi:acyl-CoA reductase-like NAD-dependent aldehyde dehydrogenase
LRAPAIRRSKILLRLARTLEGHVPTLVELEMVQTGRAIWEMPAQLGYLPECCEYGRETSLLVV